MTQENSRHPLAVFREDVKKALPTFGLPEKQQERMSSVLMVAVEKDPTLVTADRQSLIAAVRQCANHGLMPDGNEATLQTYNTNIAKKGEPPKWSRKVQYQPMVRGIINRVLNSGKVVSFYAEVVYKGEEFLLDTTQGDRRPIHKVTNQFDRGTDQDIIGVYAVAKLSNGTIDCETMGMSEIAKVRGVAKTQNVWDKWFSEKAKVAVMRRLSKRLPLSSEDMEMINNAQEHDMDREPRDVTPQDDNRPTLASRIQGRVEEPKEQPEDDPNTIDGDADIITMEWDEGKTAAEAGKKITDCPYDGGQEQADWIKGWNSVNGDQT